MALIDDFKARFPEFEISVIDKYIPILEPVYPFYYSLNYSDTTKESTLQLLAHLLAIETESMKSDPKRIISSKSVGSVSVSYEASSQGGGELTQWLRSTKYGQRFLLLTSSRYGGMSV